MELVIVKLGLAVLRVTMKEKFKFCSEERKENYELFRLDTMRGAVESAKYELSL